MKTCPVSKKPCHYSLCVGTAGSSCMRKNPPKGNVFQRATDKEPPLFRVNGHDVGETTRKKGRK